MQVISVPQPWAQLIVIGAKSIYTSPTVFNVGEALIFAEPGDKAMIRNLQRQKYFEWFVGEDDDLVNGMIIGRVNIMRVDPVEKIILANKWHHAFTNRAEKQVECALGEYLPGFFAHTIVDPIEFTGDELMKVNNQTQRAVAF